MKITFARHGEADYPLEKVPGEFPGPPLTERGHEQAMKLAERLKEHTFSKIYCSDHTRTKQTIAPYLPHANTPIHYDSRLREVTGAITGRYEDNWYEEPAPSQKERLNAFLKELQTQNGSILVVCHFSVIEYLTERLGQKITSPACGQHYILDY